jgi:hypothetical protein
MYKVLTGMTYSRQSEVTSLTILLVIDRQAIYCFLKRTEVSLDALVLEFKSCRCLTKFVLQAIEQVLVLLNRVACVGDHYLNLVDDLLLNREATIDAGTLFNSTTVNNVNLL